MLEHAQPHTPTDAAPPALNWRTLVLSVAAGVIGTALFLAGVIAVTGRAEWWRGYMAASIATLLAAGASLIPLAIGLRKGGPLLVQMFMASTGIRAVVALGICALAVGVGHFPALPTFALVIPYYLALLAVETACLARGTQSVVAQGPKR